MKKLLLIYIVCLLTASCATSTTDRLFPNYREQVKTMGSVDVLVDVVIASDIDGSDSGIDLEKHQTIAKDLTADIQGILLDKCYKLNVFHTNGGLFVENPENKKLVSTETALNSTPADSANSPDTATEASAAAPEAADEESATSTENPSVKKPKKNASKKRTKKTKNTSEESPPKFVFSKKNKSTGEVVT